MPHITGTIPVALSVYCCGRESELSGCKGMIIKNIYNLFYIKKNAIFYAIDCKQGLWQKKM